MNNDLLNNHSSKSSNRFIANKKFIQPYKSVKYSYLKNKNKANLDLQSELNKTTFIDSDKKRRPSYLKELIIAKTKIEYPLNHDPGPSRKKGGSVQGDFLSPQKQPKHYSQKTYQMPLKEFDKESVEDSLKKRNIETSGDDIEDEFGKEGVYKGGTNMKDGKGFMDISPIKSPRTYNDYVGDGFARNNKPNYTPNLNDQKVRYSKNKNLNNYTNKYGPERENEEDQFVTDSPEEDYDRITQTDRRRRPIDNIKDSTSSDAYPNKKNYAKIYVKPKSKYNKKNYNKNNKGNSKRNSPNKKGKFDPYLRKPNRDNKNDEDSSLMNDFWNLKDLGGRVDLGNYAKLINKLKKNGDDDDDDDYYYINEDIVKNIKILQKKIRKRLNDKKNKVTKIQSIWRGMGTRKIMKLYHDLEEFILLISMVNFNHFSDNFFFFINQLFNVYKAKAPENQLESIDDEEKKDNKKEDKPNKQEEVIKNKQKYDKLLNDYNDLINDNNDLSSLKKNGVNNDVNSLPGETTIGTIKTDKHRFPKSRHFSTPRKENEYSFNDNSKDQRASCSDLRSEGSSNYFDNEQPGRDTTPLRNNSMKNRINRRPKIGLVTLIKKNDRFPSYSPFSNGNSTNRNYQNDSQLDNRINLSIVPKHEDEFEIIRTEKEFEEPKQLENDFYDKYANDFGRDLRIVKLDKINLKNPNNKKLYCFDNELMYPENENNLELVAPKKSDEQKIRDIFANKQLFDKMKKKMDRLVKSEKKLVKHYGDSISLKNDKNIYDNRSKNRISPSINNLEILQNDHRNFSPSRLDLDFTELFLAKDPKSTKKKKQQKLVPTFEKEIKIKRINRLKDPSSFSKDKTLPSFDDTEDKNSFTIRNKVPKKERKPVRFPKEKTIIDRVYNTDFSLIESSPVRRPPEIMKEIILIPSPHIMFKRLRRSKRLKDTYFTIKGEPNKNKNKDSKFDKNKDLLLESTENNFQIKNEYYYIETLEEDKSPPVIEKEVIKTIVVEKPNKKFKDGEVTPTREDKFDIKADKNKNKYLEDIETNELMIPSEITHKTPQKRWENLNPMANDEFSFGNDDDNFYDYYNDIPRDNKNDYNISLDIDNEQFAIINVPKDRQKDYVRQKENNIKLMGKIVPKEDKDIQADIRPMKTTLRTLVNKPKLSNYYQNYYGDAFSIFGTKKSKDKLPKEIRLIKKTNCQLNILKQKKDLRDNGTEVDLKPLKEFDNIKYMFNDDFAIKKIEKLKSNKGTEITDELRDYEKKRKEKLLRNVKNTDMEVKGIKKEMVETETEIDRDLNKIEIYFNEGVMYHPSKKKINNIVSKGDNLDIFAPKKKLIIKPSKIDNINLESRNKAFPRLYMSNFLSEEYEGQKKEKEKPKEKKKEKVEEIRKPTFRRVKYDSFMFNPVIKRRKYLIEFRNDFLIKALPKKKEIRTHKNLKMDKSEEYLVFGKKEPKEVKPKPIMKECSTQIEDDLIKIIPEKNEDFLFKPTLPLNKLRPEKRYMAKPERFMIEGLDKNIGLETYYLKGLTYGPTKNKQFRNLYLDKCQDEIFTGKEKEKIILRLINNEPIELSGKEKEEILEFIRNEPIALNGKEKENLIKYIKNESLLIKGKEPTKPKKTYFYYVPGRSIELKGEERDTMYDPINNEPIELKGEEKEEQILDPYYIEPIELVGKEKDKEEKEPQKFDPIYNEPISLNGKRRPDLRRIKNKPVIFKGKDIEKDLKKIKNASLSFKPKYKKPRKKKTKTVGTSIDKDLNKFLISKRNAKLTFKPTKKKKRVKLYTIETNEQFTIKKKILKKKPKIKKKVYPIVKNEQFTIKKKILKKKPKAPPVKKKVFSVVNNDQFTIKKLKKKPKKKKLKLKLENQKPFTIVPNKKNSKEDIDLEKLLLPKETYDKDKKSDINDNLIVFVDKIELKGKDEEKPKNVDKLKDNIPKIYNIIRLLDALSNKPKDKKDFMDKLKNLKKDDKNKLSCVTKDQIKLSGKDKKEKEKPKFELNQQPQEQFTIPQKKKKLNEKEPKKNNYLKNIKPIQNDKFSFIGKDKEEEKEKDKIPEIKKDDVNKSEEEEEEEEPKKKKPRKKPYKNLEKINENSFSYDAPEPINDEKDKPDEKKKEKVDTIDASTQTPKLRPANKDPKKVVFHDIQTITKKEDSKPSNEKKKDGKP